MNSDMNYGKDIVDMITEQLSQQLADEIDKEIINQILNRNNRKDRIRKVLDLLNRKNNGFN